MRRLADLGWRAATAACGLVCLAVVAGLLGYLLWRAWPTLDLAFLVEPARESGAAGGVRYQILGTALLAVTTLAVSVPVGVALALVVGVYGARRPRLREAVRAALFTAHGTPSILFGVFGLLLFGRWLGWGKSWLAGGLVLGAMAVPTVALALVERIEALPSAYLDAGRALGLGRAQLIWRVILPQSRDGLLSGALLGVARAAGETAPILFAAAVFAGATVPTGIRESPVTALPYHVFVLAQDTFDPAARARLWGAAWVLLSMALVAAALALPIRLRLTTEARHD